MSEQLTATDIRAALRARWPESEYLHLEEAPQDAGRQGRKLDVLVISQWASRGHQIDGVEIKVSMSDWKRELDHPEKADWWVQRVHRFWIACPVAIASKIRVELPPAWGLIAIDSTGGTKAVVKAPVRQAQPLGWESVVGLLRAAADAGPNALQRAEGRGFERGVAEGKRQTQVRDADGRARAELAALSERVRAFLDSAGLRDWEIHDIDGAAKWGAILAAVRRWKSWPGRTLQDIDRIAGNLTREAADMRALRTELATLLEAGTAAEGPNGGGQAA